MKNKLQNSKSIPTMYCGPSLMPISILSMTFQAVGQSVQMTKILFFTQTFGALDYKQSGSESNLGMWKVTSAG